MAKEINRLEEKASGGGTVRFIEFDNGTFDVHCMTLKNHIACKKLCNSFNEAWEHFEELIVELDCDVA